MNYSIVMPVYLREEKHKKTVLKTLKNLNENSTDCELIVVNDGSVLDISFLSDYADTVINQENSGISTAWNTGKNRAHSEYVAIVNDDIEVPISWLDKLAERFEDVKTGVSAPYLGGMNIRPALYSSKINIYNHKFYPGYCFMLRKDRFFEDFDPQFKSNCGDVDYWHRIRKSGLELSRAMFSVWHKEGGVLHGMDYGSLSKHSLALFVKKWGFDPRKEYYS